MAAQAPPLLLLLLPLFSNIQAELIWGAGWSHTFYLDNTADFCSVSRWTAAGKQLLWNSSGSYYWVKRLAVSHSGQYQTQCWTRGKLMLDRKSTLLVCDDQKMRRQSLFLDVGQTAELTCDGAGPNQSVQWAYDNYRSEGLALIDNETSSVFRLSLVKNKPSLQLTVDRSDTVSYFCLDRQQLSCDLHSQFVVQVPPKYILRSVGESLELNCSDASRTQTHTWRMYNSLGSERESLSSTLMLPSLRLEHSGSYTCDLGATGRESYRLYVCPEPEPPAVQLFTEGEDLTLHCGDQTDVVHWFMRSNRTEGRVFDVGSRRLDNMYRSNSSLVMRNVSLLDSGQVWCQVMRGDLCVFSSETLLKLREPEVDPLLLRSVMLSAAVLLMLCVVGGVEVKVWRGRRGEQLPAAVEEMQMSPESEAQEEEEAPV